MLANILIVLTLLFYDCLAKSFTLTDSRRRLWFKIQLFVACLFSNAPHLNLPPFIVLYRRFAVMRLLVNLPKSARGTLPHPCAQNQSPPLFRKAGLSTNSFGTKNYLADWKAARNLSFPS